MAQERWLNENQQRLWRLYVDVQHHLEGVLHRELLAESGLYGHAFASLGATARKHRLAGLGLHPGTEPVSLTPPPAVGLKCALRHAAMHSYSKNFTWSKP